MTQTNPKKPRSAGESAPEPEALYTALTNRPAFSYDPGSDPMYRSYAQQYTQNGRMAMRDTMGQAAALTGGYGSSYAQSAGQQQYDEYLRSLSQVLPELYGMAYQQYSDQTQSLRDNYDIAYQRQQAQTEAERYAAEQAYKRQQSGYSSLYQLIASTGYYPSEQELSAAGLSREQAEALRNEYLRKNGLLPQSGGSAVYYAPSSAASDTAHAQKQSSSGSKSQSTSSRKVSKR